MKTLDIYEKLYNDIFKNIIEEKFQDIKNYIAVGIMGPGSDCYGYDDDISLDHDIEPSLCVFIPGEDIIDRRTAFKLERAYSDLPKEFMGLKKNLLGPVDDTRRGVLRINEYFKERLNTEDGTLTIKDYFTIPEFSFSECTNGKIFTDPYGKITEIRNKLKYYPEDIRLKKIAANLMTMGQSGQYNFERCIKHGEKGAAQLAAVTFVKSTMQVMFLLDHTYMPYYKWSFRALRNTSFSDYSDSLEYILCTSNDRDNADVKHDMIEDISGIIIDRLMNDGITGAICGDLNKHAYSVEDHIKNPEVRNLNIFTGSN